MNKASKHPPPPVVSILMPLDNNEQGQEALLVQEARHRSFLRRSSSCRTAKSVLLAPHAHDSKVAFHKSSNHHEENNNVAAIVLSEDSFEQALLARQAIEGKSMSAELQLVLSDAVQKGQAAIRNREMDRALQLLEFIIVPTSASKSMTTAATKYCNDMPRANDAPNRPSQQQQAETPAELPVLRDKQPEPLAPSDTISSLGFDLSMGNNGITSELDLMSMSSLNEILDAPLTPEQKKNIGTRFRLFSRFVRKKPVPLPSQDSCSDDSDDSTTSPERFVTTVVISDGTMVEDRMTSVQRIVEDVVKEEKDDESTDSQEVALEDAVLWTKNELEDTPMDASQIMENLNETSLIMEEMNKRTGEVIVAASTEATALDGKTEETTEHGQPPIPRSPLMRLLQRRTSKHQLTELSKTENELHTMDQPFESTETPINAEESSPASPTTTVVLPTDERYAFFAMMPSVDCDDDDLILESEDFVDPDDRYAIPADPCSFCDTLFRIPATLPEHEMAERSDDPDTTVEISEEEIDFSLEVDEEYDLSLEVDDEDNDVDKYRCAQIVLPENRTIFDDVDEKNKNVHQDNTIFPQAEKTKKKKRFALFRRRKPKPQRSITRSVHSADQIVSVSSKKPLQGILKAPSKSFPIDVTAVLGDDLPPSKDGGSTSTVTSHDDDVDPLVDRLKQQQRGIDPGLHEQRQLRLEP